MATPAEEVGDGQRRGRESWKKGVEIGQKMDKKGKTIGCNSARYFGEFKIQMLTLVNEIEEMYPRTLEKKTIN